MSNLTKEEVLEALLAFSEKDRLDILHSFCHACKEYVGDSACYCTRDD